MAYSRATSKSLLKPNIFYVVDTGYLMTVNKQTTRGFQHALKLHFTRKKVSLLDLLEGEKIYCAWCAQPNASWLPLFHIDARKHITLTGIHYVNKLLCCGIPKNGCRSKSLNPNSIEFVSKSRGISEEAALRYIHDRNKSPFYIENHSNKEDYQKYQGTRLTAGKTEEEYRAIIDKQNYSRSLEGFIERYGPDGEEKWYRYCEEKGITVKNLRRKWGDLAEVKVLDWKNQVAPSLKNYIKRYGEELGLEKHREFIENVSTRGDQLYSFISISPNGDTLRSNYERAFYAAMEKTGLVKEDYKVDDYYPNSSKRYDFHFQAVDLYIEIAGLNDPEYLKNLQAKIDEFKPMVLKPKDVSSFVKICYDIRTRIFQATNRSTHKGILQW